MIDATPQTEALYRASWTTDKGVGRVHHAESFIPLNSLAIALVTNCGIRTDQFFLASKYDKEHNGICLKCKSINAKRIEAESMASA